MKRQQVYCDYAASTPVAYEVSEQMRQFQVTNGPGNASSLHKSGRAIRELMDTAHDNVATLLGCDFQDVLFTSGGTESDNLAIIGAFLARRETGRNGIVVGAAEHHAVLDAAKFAAKFLGAHVAIARVDSHARIDMDHLSSLMNEHTAIVSVQHANNETGCIQPVSDVALQARRWGAWFHCDAVQTPVTVPFKASDIGADLVTISSHKIYGPTGIGALISSVPIQPLHVGGAQERGLRAGTENVLGAVGFGAAAALEVARQLNGRNEIASVMALVDELTNHLRNHPRIIINTPAQLRVATILHLSVIGTSTEDLLVLLDRNGISASGGAACASGAVEPSHVVKACGWSERRQAGALRFSFGLGTTSEHINHVKNVLGLIASSG